MLGWTPDGRVVLLATNDHTLLWAPDGTLADPRLWPGALAYGPTMADHAVEPASAGGPTSVRIQSARGSMTVPTQAALTLGSDVVWTTDGQAVFVHTSSGDAQQVMDQLLRVPMP